MGLNPKISVIMPVYNTGEEYLRKAVESVLAQTYSDFEFIIVDDGSKNNAQEVINSYKDDRIKYVYQENSGQSKARNNALKLAVGEYVFFIDADDWIEINTFELILNKSETLDSEILFFGAYNVNEKTKEITNVFNVEYFPDEGISLKPDDSRILKDIFFKIYTCWGAIFKRSFLINNNIFFQEGLVFEDIEFIHNAIMKSSKIGFLKAYLYYYRVELANSTISNANEKHFDIIKIFDLLENLLIEYNFFDKLEFEFYNFKVGAFIQRYNNIRQDLKEKFADLAKESLKKAQIKKDEFEKLKLFNYFLYELL